MFPFFWAFVRLISGPRYNAIKPFLNSKRQTRSSLPALRRQPKGTVGKTKLWPLPCVSSGLGQNLLRLVPSEVTQKRRVGRWGREDVNTGANLFLRACVQYDARGLLSLASAPFICSRKPIPLVNRSYDRGCADDVGSCRTHTPPSWVGVCGYRSQETALHVWLLCRSHKGRNLCEPLYFLVF